MTHYLFIGGTLDGQFVDVPDYYDRYSAPRFRVPEALITEELPIEPVNFETDMYQKKTFHAGGKRYAVIFVLENLSIMDAMSKLINGYAGYKQLAKQYEKAL